MKRIQKELDAIKDMTKEQLVDAATDLIANDISNLVERVIRHRVKLWVIEIFKNTKSAMNEVK